jgi:hypothetical protein
MIYDDKGQIGALQAEGHWFEPSISHQKGQSETAVLFLFYAL